MTNLLKKYRMYKQKEKALDCVYKYAGEFRYFVTELRQSKHYHEYAVCDPKNMDVSLVIKVALDPEYDTLKITTSYATAEHLGKYASNKATAFGKTESLTYNDYRKSKFNFEVSVESTIIKGMDYIKLLRAIV